MQPGGIRGIMPEIIIPHSLHILKCSIGQSSNAGYNPRTFNIYQIALSDYLQFTVNIFKSKNETFFWGTLNTFSSRENCQLLNLSNVEGPFSTLWVKIARMCRFGSASTFLLLSWSIYGLTLPFLELLPKMPWRSGDRDAKLMAVGDVNDNHCWYHGLLMCAGQIGIDSIGGPPITNGGRIYRTFEFRNFAPTPHLFL